MSRPTHAPRPPRILLCGVFGPYGVDDAYGRKENVMELFHNQVTRGQGLGSFRFQHRSFGLYFLAANVDADVTVLDFPSKRRLAKELRRGYDIVGISFITPNFKKAQEMARMTRRLAPGATILLGGHGAAIEDVERLIDCDHVVRGEGIGWLRRFLGQDPAAPIVHPCLPSVERASIFGVPVPGHFANLLVPGVGCVNGCKFCSTSHFFGKRYTSFFSSGQELFQVASAIADQSGSDEFFVMDENFLKDRQRGLELIAEMERHQRFFSFHIFSSAEAIAAFGLDNLERLGVTFVWIGVESKSKQGNYAKNAALDARQLIAALQARGIIVLASGILCAEHHTQENIQAEIDFFVDLRADFLQFMLLTPLPVTALYRQQQASGVLRQDLPFEEWHGQKILAYRHPEFSGDTAERWINRAFRQEYEQNSCSLLRVTRTVFAGYRRLARLGPLTPGLAARKQALERCARLWSCMLPTVARLAVNDAERRRARQLKQEIERELPLTAMERVFDPAATGLALAWALRVKLRGDRVQPRTICTRYRAAGSCPRAVGLPRAADGVLPSPGEQSLDEVGVAAAISPH